MSHSFCNCLMHVVFSTKERQTVLTPDIRTRLFPFPGGIARENKMKALCVGGVVDHVHLLLSLPSTIPVAKALQLIKGGSSKWMHETFASLRNVGWQEGYGAFSIGISGVEETIAYIENQEEHHRKMTFKEEYIAFLERHGITYDDRYIWD